jgi:AcrR family transcriptional regulator
MARDERRAQILRAAATAFAEQGYAATSVDDVARAAGITKLIVYRHYDSKAELYRSILERVSARLVEEWLAEIHPTPRPGAAVRTLLTVSREWPESFRLLFVHAAREHEFAQFAAGFRSLQVAAADQVLGDALTEEPFRTWVTRVVIEFLVAGVLEWTEVGDPSEDEVFVDRATAGLEAMVRCWVDRVGDAAVNSGGAAPPRPGRPARR